VRNDSLDTIVRNILILSNEKFPIEIEQKSSDRIDFTVPTAVGEQIE
jgi:hypothetical protein